MNSIYRFQDREMHESQEQSHLVGKTGIFLVPTTKEDTINIIDLSIFLIFCFLLQNKNIIRLTKTTFISTIAYFCPVINIKKLEIR